MSLRALPPLLRREPALAEVAGLSHATLAVPDPATAYVLAGLRGLRDQSTRGRPMVVVTPTVVDAEHLAHDLAAFIGPEQVELLPPWDTLPFERVSPDVTTMGQRLRVLWRLGLGTPDGPPATTADRDTSSEPDGPGELVVVAPIRSLLQRLSSTPEAAVPIEISAGDRVDLDSLVARLVSLGYRREYQVEHRGEVAVRGGIVDVYPSTGELPVRIDLWGDEVDRLTQFDPGDQRSLAQMDTVTIFGCREVLPTDAVRERAAGLVGREPWGRSQWERLADGQLFDGMESWLPWLADGERVLPDLLPEGSQVVLIDPRRIRDRGSEVIDDEEALAKVLATTWGIARPGENSQSENGQGENGQGENGTSGTPDPQEAPSLPRLHVRFDRLLTNCAASVLSVVPVADRPDVPAVSARGWEAIFGDAESLASRLTALVDDGFSVTVCADATGSATRMAQVLADEGLHLVGDDQVGRPGIRLLVVPLDRGFILPSAKVAVLAEPDVTGRRRAHRRARTRARVPDTFFDDLAPGDYVVHRQHGVARFAGVVTRTMGGSTRDYLLLEYRGDDKLYLPTDQVEAITPYTGGESPTLSRLGGAEWQRTRAKARAAVHEIAEDLVALYQERLSVEGHAYGPDTPWQREMEDGFAYVETSDQLRAIQEVKADMESPRPMDRLVCADVGFGKTEIAVRAAFKAVQDGKQVAVLVPTTLLAQQHAVTFADRFAGYPVRVEMLSRFLTPAQAKAVVAGLAAGTVDVVIGTHRLLGGDIRFKDLGLLVVDEEQRFGVGHKETIKTMAKGVDILTLTANPIPRTLEMALTGIRDLSLVATPPAERQPILTFVGEIDEAAVVEAVRRELLREGQVFYVHNVVHDIDRVALRLKELVPEARVAVAHGQMDEGTLEQVVLDFWERKADVLVCTTIVESGIDMPSVNTLVVDQADRLGLGQLHQLRGRAGRSGQRAYVYLFYPEGRALPETAYERLRTIGEHTDLGSGFKIAMRDLEIRGAGNLLGRDQSGHIGAVGYDLYVQMVAEAVAELKGDPRPAPPVEVKLDLPTDAHLPADYMAREDLRLEAYRRLASVTSAADVADVRAEWEDRFGPPPPPAEALLDVARLRAECVRTGVTDLSVGPARPGAPAGTSGRRLLVAKLSPLHLAASAQVRLRRVHPHAEYREGSGLLTVPLPSGGPPAQAVLALLGELVPPPADGATAEAG